MVEIAFPENAGILHWQVQGLSAPNTGNGSYAHFLFVPFDQGLNSVFSFFFTATPLIFT
jgi:hypothetical protein